MHECKTLQEVTWFRYCNMDITYYIEDKKVIFIVDEEQEGYSDCVLEYIQAKQDFYDVTISLNKWLKAEKWVKDRIYEAKR